MLGFSGMELTRGFGPKTGVYFLPANPRGFEKMWRNFGLKNLLP